MTSDTPQAPDDDTSTGIERRRAPRVDLQPDRLRVQLSSLADFLELYAMNISTTGMFLGTTTPLPKGTRFRFSFEFLRDSEPLTGIGEVAWVREGTGGGIGIHFVDLNESAKTMIATIVEAQRREVLKHS